MPSLELPAAPHYVHPPPTRVDLEYANLPIIDLSQASTLEGRIALSVRVRDAMAEHGFFYVINHGHSRAQSERIFDIANVPFEQVTAEEKETYAGTMKKTGSYQGYKLRQYWHIDGGVHDQLEHYNINRDITKRGHPQPLRPFLPEISQFARHNHTNVLHPILRLLALGLELPEETLVNIHGFDAVGETYVRFMKYYPRSEDEEAKTKNVWLKGHTDFGTITILYSQPVSGLQILTRGGIWKWVKHVENALVINAGDALEFLSGGFYRATIHSPMKRVIQPPEDQRRATRLGVFYFCMSDDNVKLTPLVESPVLQQVGITRRFEDDTAPTMEIWRKGRTAQYGRSELKASSEKGVEEETIAGAMVQGLTTHIQMPNLDLPEVPHYVSAPVTKVDLEYADLPIIDLSKASTPEGRLALSVQVRDAMMEHGFFYVINHGYTLAQTERIFDIANIPFDHVTSEEKIGYVATMKETGSYQGYKLRQYWHIDGGVHDQIEKYGIHRDVTKRGHPQPLRPFLPEISRFARHNHFNILHQLLRHHRLFAIGLELPEETLVDIHGFDSPGDTSVRFMKYYPRSQEDEKKAKNVWLKGHTGLQILARNGVWKWVKHIEDAL
ncbi:hypothetical protein C0995_004364, partial [Termitomyces sp. Mi166